MKTFKLTISSPDGDVFSADVLSISLRGADGDLAIMAGHIPFITSVLPCKCKIELEDKDVTGSLEGGILTVTGSKVTLLTGSFNFTDSE